LSAYAEDNYLTNVKLKQLSTATKLVKDLQEKQIEMVGPPDEHMVSMLDKSYLLLGFEFRNLFSILDRGFLNQHNRDTLPQDQFFPEGRLKIESIISRVNWVNINETSNIDQQTLISILPKYAHAVFEGDQTDIKHWGEVYAILKPEVKTRSTWTPFDSANLEEYWNSTSIEAVSERLLSNGFVNTFASVKRIHINTSVIARNYKEAQIWGSLTLSDVAYFVFPSKPLGAPEWFIPFQDLAVQKLLRSGIDVYVYDSTDNNRHRALENRSLITPDNYRDHIEFLSLDRLKKLTNGYYRHPDYSYYLKSVKKHVEYLILPFVSTNDQASVNLESEIFDFLARPKEKIHCENIFTSE
jgi:hypothetical protein